MYTYKCRVCAADFQAEEGLTYIKCDTCDNTFTHTKSKEDAIHDKYSRAYELLRQCEFDRAEEIFQEILSYDHTDAEAYWCIIQCRYGVEYVKDTSTNKYLLTCRRIQQDPIDNNSNYQLALEYSDNNTKDVYVAQAKNISEIQSGYFKNVDSKQQYDVFICVRGTSSDGSHNKDNELAQDIGDRLEKNGHSVFVSGLMLSGMSENEYESQVTYALDCAGTMLIIGTSPSSFTDSRVANQWSRFLSLIKKEPRRQIIQCYNDMEPNELPQELSNFPRLNMSKITFLQDVDRLINHSKINEKNEAETVESITNNGWQLLKEKRWDEAEAEFVRASEIYSDYAPSIMGRYCAINKLTGLDAAKGDSLRNDKRYKAALKIATPAYRVVLERAAKDAEDRVKEEIYVKLFSRMREAEHEDTYEDLSQEFHKLGDYKDSQDLAARCKKEAKIFNYNALLSKKNKASAEDDFLWLKVEFEKHGDFLDAPKLAVACAIAANDLIREGEYNRLLTEKSGVLYENDSAVEILNDLGNRFNALGEYRDSQYQANDCFNERDKILNKQNKDKRSFRGWIILRIIILIVGLSSIIAPLFVFYNGDSARLGEDSMMSFIVISIIAFFVFSILYLARHDSSREIKIVCTIISVILFVIVGWTGCQTSGYNVGAGGQLVQGSVDDNTLGMTLVISSIVYLISCILARIFKRS